MYNKHSREGTVAFMRRWSLYFRGLNTIDITQRSEVYFVFIWRCPYIGVAFIHIYIERGAHYTELTFIQNFLYLLVQIQSLWWGGAISLSFCRFQTTSPLIWFEFLCNFIVIIHSCAYCSSSRNCFVYIIIIILWISMRDLHIVLCY